MNTPVADEELDDVFLVVSDILEPIARRNHISLVTLLPHFVNSQKYEVAKRQFYVLQDAMASFLECFFRKDDLILVEPDAGNSITVSFDGGETWEIYTLPELPVAENPRKRSREDVNSRMLPDYNLHFEQLLILIEKTYSSIVKKHELALGNESALEVFKQCFFKILRDLLEQSILDKLVSYDMDPEFNHSSYLKKSDDVKHKNLKKMVIKMRETIRARSKWNILKKYAKARHLSIRAADPSRWSSLLAAYAQRLQEADHTSEMRSMFNAAPEAPSEFFGLKYQGLAKHLLSFAL